MNISLKITSFLVFFTIVLSCFTVFIGADDINSISDIDKAKSICLYNIESDTTVYSKNMQEKIFPGSAVKMMTGIIACEMLADRLEEKILITDEMLKDAEGFNVKLKVGMYVTVENLLYGALCGGGNDAAIALAIVCGGDIDSFVSIMNAQASKWGHKNTDFTNPTGLDDSSMYTTLSDIMIIAKKASQNKLYLDISSTASYIYTPEGSSEQIKFFNRNALISTFYAYGYKNDCASGLISGNTSSGGYCVITYAERNGQSYICAVMGAEADDNSIYSYKLANSLLSYAFNNLEYQYIAKQGQHICYADVRFVVATSDSESLRLSCVVKNDVYALINSDINVETDLTYRYYFHNEILDAPISAGMIVGGVDIIYNGEIIGNAMLVAADDIEGEGMLIFLDNLKDFFTDRLFWLCVIFFVLIFCSYYYFSELRFHRKNVKEIKYKNFY